MRQRLGFESLVVVNDFTALAMALPRLAARPARAGGRRHRPASAAWSGCWAPVRAWGVGPDPGRRRLGRAGHRGRPHQLFAARRARDRHPALRLALFPHVSFERLLSGPGLELIHRALRDRGGRRRRPLAAPEITRRALDGSDALCVETLESFCAMLGTMAPTWRSRWAPPAASTSAAASCRGWASTSTARPFASASRTRAASATTCAHPDLRDHGRARHLPRRLGHPGRPAAPTEEGSAAARAQIQPRASAVARPRSAWPTTCWRTRARR
jgi:hypothetical protein